ncbi:MAG: SipW-dependent-type signal peptide-containing protein [Acutalibacteraceae bacterium]
MNNTKTTKRALLSSVMAMLICVAMLIGTTFAWFTDKASTTVNKIQAGNLKVQLLDENGNSLEGVPLTWQKAAGHETEEVLWEPGCTYNLKSFKIRNNGDLALKYKIAISGIDGDAELNEVIDWSYTLADGSAFPITAEGHLAAGQETGLITISGHMQESAGNEYQGKFIDGIGITVAAAQDTVEADSFGIDYDADAVYPIAFTAKINKDANNKLTTALNFGTSAATVSETKPVSVSVPEGVKVEETAANFEVLIEESESHPNVTIGAGSSAIAYNIEMPLAEDNDVPVKITKFIGTGIALSEVYHDTILMTEADTGFADTYQYDPATGVITMYITHCSTFTFVEVPDYTVSNFDEFTSALNEAEPGDLIALTADINPTTNFTFSKSVIINLNGYGFVRAKEASGGYGITLKPNCDLTMRNGRWDMAGTFGDIRAEGNYGTCNVKYENVVFTNLDNPTKEELAAKPGNSSNLVKTAFKANMQGNFKVNATFTNCTFNNASAEFSGFNSDNTYTAEFEGCTFNNVGNSCAIKADNYGMSENCKVTVTDCQFNITVTSNVSLIETRYNGNTVKLNLTDNIVNGTKADSGLYKVFSSQSLKVYTASQKFDVTESGTTLQGITTMN